MPSHQTCHNSSRGSEEVLYLFEVFRNPRCQPSPLIHPDIFNFFSRTTTTCEVTRLARNVPQEVLLHFRVIWYTAWSSWPLIGWDIFGIFSKLYHACHQACQKFSSKGFEEVVIFFGALWNSRRLFWLLIGLDIFYCIQTLQKCSFREP